MDFPLQLSFKVVAISPQITVTDASGRLLFYVKQKAFKLKEAVTVFADPEQTRPLFRIAADRVLDISAQYHIEDAAGAPLGLLQRRGMRSLWRAHYEIHRGGGPILAIHEENPWVKVIDGLLGEVPILGMLTGYFFHPAYRVARAVDDAPVLRAVKQPAFFEGRYTIERVGELSESDETLAVLSVLMMLLLERQRG
ncbi:MAG TPA: hypothetical protein VGR37_24685 [Longimicrobiaceae bacterium]|nr:hypothetical protein [Longimicrobiaceae bacterium]